MASIIDPKLAKSLIKEFQQQNVSPAGPALKTPDGQNLNGYFIDRQSLEAALNNPNCVGIGLNFAKHPDFAGQAGNIFTMIFAGAEPNNAPDANTPYICKGNVFDMLPPCPPFCTDLGM